MAVVRYTPLDDFLRSVMVKPLTETKDQALSLAIDVRENEHAYLVSADIPGARKEDIQVNINGAHVSISVERKNEKSVNEQEKILRSERSFGKYLGLLKWSTRLTNLKQAQNMPKVF